MEPPRTRVPDRSGPPLLNTTDRRIRVRRRVEARAAPPPAVDDRPAFPLTNAALLAAALVLALTSRGDVVVLAVLLGLGCGRRWSGLAAAGALGAAMVRWGSPSLGAIAGAQAVVGPAGWTGNGAAVASAWFGAAALVLAAVPLVRTSTVARALSVSPFAVAAADVAVGPSPGGALGWRIVATVVALALTTAITRWRWSWPWVAQGCAVAALACAGFAR